MAACITGDTNSVSQYLFSVGQILLRESATTSYRKPLWVIMQPDINYLLKKVLNYAQKFADVKVQEKYLIRFSILNSEDKGIKYRLAGFYVSQGKYKEANKWSLSEMTAYTTGTGSAKDLIEALGALLLVEKELAETEFNLCLAAAKLAMEIGDQGTLKSWRE